MVQHILVGWMDGTEDEGAVPRAVIWRQINRVDVSLAAVMQAISQLCTIREV